MTFETGNGVLSVSNTVSGSCLSGSYANVVPQASWTHDELVDFAEKYPGYCRSIVDAGIVSPGLFAGIPLPTYEREPRKLSFWSRLKASWR